MKKLILPIVIILLLACATLVFAACDEVPSNGDASFTLNFMVDGTVYYSVSTKGNESITMPATPQKTGYRFDNWYWDQNVWQKPFTASSLLSVALTENMSVYARFVPIDNGDTIGGGSGGGTPIGDHTHVWGDWEVTREPTCQREGSKMHSCTVCGRTEYEQIPTVPHEYNADGVCTMCGASKEDDASLLAAQTNARNVLISLLSNTGGAMPVSALIALSDKSTDGAIDYLFVFEDGALVDKSVSSLRNGSAGYPVYATDTRTGRDGKSFTTHTFVIFVTSQYFSKELTAEQMRYVEKHVADVLDYTMSGKTSASDTAHTGTLHATTETKSGYDYAVWTYEKAAPVAREYVNMRVYWNADMGRDSVFFYANTSISEIIDPSEYPAYVDPDDPTDPGTGGAEPSNPTAGKELTEAELGVYKTPTDTLVIFAEQYLTNYATDEADVHTALTKALQTQADKMEGNPVSKVVATLDKDGFYSLKFTYKSKDTYVYHKEGSLAKRTAERGVYAGYAMEGTAADYDSTLAVVYNAFLRTVQKAVRESQAFGEDYKAAAMGDDTAGGVKFGGSVEAAFFFNYGVGEDQIGPVSYGIKVYGTLGYNAADTQVAVEIINELDSRVVIGIYYKYATLYLNLNFGDYRQKLKIDSADINAILGGILGEKYRNACEHEYHDGYCTKCGAKEPEELDEPFYESFAPNYTSIRKAFADLTGGNSIVGTVVALVGSFLTCTQTTVGSNTRYQYQIDIDKLISTILDNEVLGSILNDALNPVLESIFPELDLNGFKGIGGTLLFSFDVTAGSNATLAGAQIAYNAAQKDFRWNAEDAEAKLYGPINAAITVSDFAIDNRTSVSVNDSEYSYFNPLDLEVTGNVNIKDNNEGITNRYEVTLRTHFNVFELVGHVACPTGQAEFIVYDRNNYETKAHVYVHDLVYSGEDGWDCTVTVYYDGVYYETLASRSRLAADLMAYLLEAARSGDPDFVLTPVFDYVWELVEQLDPIYTESEFDADVMDLRMQISALQVTKHEYSINYDGTKTDLGVMPSSAWLDSIKSQALQDIDSIVSAVQSETYGYAAEEKSPRYKSAIEELKAIVAQAKADYIAQLKLEDKYESVWDDFDLIAFIANLSALKELFIDDEGKPTDPSVFDYSINNWYDAYLHLDLDYTTYNRVIDILKMAMPKLENVDRYAPHIKVEMNTPGYRGQWYFYMASGDDVLEIRTNIVSVLGTMLLSGDVYENGTMYADVKVCKNGVNYVYRATIDCDNWNHNGGTIIVSLKESEGYGVTTARDEFIHAEFTLYWSYDGNFEGFDLALRLNTRDRGGYMNAEREYHISYERDEEGNHTITVEECGIIFSFRFDGLYFDHSNTLSLGLPALTLGFSYDLRMGENDVSVTVEQLRVSKWGTRVNVVGIDTTGKTVIRNTETDNAMDVALFEIIVDKLNQYLYYNAE